MAFRIASAVALPNSPPSAHVTLVPEQGAAVDAFMAWFTNAPRHVGANFVIQGFAGTGKTTLAREIALRVRDMTRQTPLFCAYTGKAARVLGQKSGFPASTIDGLRYRNVWDPAANDWRKVPHGDNKEAPLILADECSMISERYRADLLTLGPPVLFLGDPFQLPPVGSALVDWHPNCMLTEIHRQARDNPIYAASLMIRESRVGEAKKLLGTVHHRDVTEDLAGSVDQILCGTHATRKAANAWCRRRRGVVDGDWVPHSGEKVICKRNSREFGICNGDIFEVIKARATMSGGVLLTVNIRGCVVGVHADGRLFRGEDIQRGDMSDAIPFDWAYALTVASAQGSEWDSVMLRDDWNPEKADYKNWLYTGVTRAKEKMVLAV